MDVLPSLTARKNFPLNSFLERSVEEALESAVRGVQAAAKRLEVGEIKFPKIKLYHKFKFKALRSHKYPRDVYGKRKLCDKN